MRLTRAVGAALCAALLAAAWPGSPALAYGPEGHLIAGRAAEPLLCARAAEVVARLGDGQDLGELGLWADRIRAEPAYADSAPWHYMNIDDDAAISDFVHPPEGDVLWAIEHFSERLANGLLDDAARAEALKFLVHFVVDLHQPLHVGRAGDRGGNAVKLEFRGEETNLHRYWDTHAIETSGRSVSAYVAAIRESAVRGGGRVDLNPERWAAESLALRDRVYAFGREGREPSRGYATFAAETTEQRLGLAAMRLAGTLNSLLCD
jgi:hypothetical protein